jgi:hypothetical protein
LEKPSRCIGLIFSVVLCFSLLFLMPACKSNSTSPTPPTTVTVTSITVTSVSTMLKVGQTETFTATCNMSNGTSQAATGTWSSSATSVATVSNVGLVTIVGAGNANIIMTQSGKTGQKGIRGVPDYQGTWGPGTYRIDSCSNTGDFATGGFCATYPVGTILQTTLIMTQTSDMVNCTFFLGVLSSTASGQIATNGQVTLTGRYTGGTTSIDVVYVLQQTTPGQLTGTLGQLWTDTTASGNGQYGCTIVMLSRTSPAPNEAAVSRTVLPKGATYRDLLNAIGIR